MYGTVCGKILTPNQHISFITIFPITKEAAQSHKQRKQKRSLGDASIHKAEWSVWGWGVSWYSLLERVKLQVGENTGKTKLFQSLTVKERKEWRVWLTCKIDFDTMLMGINRKLWASDLWEWWRHAVYKVRRAVSKKILIEDRKVCNIVAEFKR